MHGVALFGDVRLPVLDAEKDRGEAHDGLMGDLTAGDSGTRGYQIGGFDVCYGGCNEAIAYEVRLGVADVYIEADDPGRG